MKIVMGNSPSKVRVYDDEGKDITSDLRIRDINVTVSCDEGPLVQMSCYVDEVVVKDVMKIELTSLVDSADSGDFDEEDEEIEATTLLTGSPEAILDQFKVK